jgi:hypothetical protein
MRFCTISLKSNLPTWQGMHLATTQVPSFSIVSLSLSLMLRN